MQIFWNKIASVTTFLDWNIPKQKLKGNNFFYWKVAIVQVILLI